MVKINELQLENVKRIKAVKIEPTKNGLTVIGGRNGQGKTSVLDSIAWALGGERFRPSQAGREGSAIPPHLHISLSNGLIVERKGKNSTLKVTDPNGAKAGQQLLNEFISELALDLPKFMQSSNKEKASVLLRIIGIEDTLKELEHNEQILYNRRYEIGRIADQKEKFAREMPEYPDAPKELISVSDLIIRQQEILAKNGENQRKRLRLAEIEKTTAELESQINSLQAKLKVSLAALETAKKSAENLQDESTQEIETSIANIEEINIKVRANYDKEKANMDAEDYKRQYAELTDQITAIREERIKLLDNAHLPLNGLSVSDGELTYRGFKWDNMSSAEQLKVSTAIVRKLNPECGFVLMDKLEQMDAETLEEFGKWLEAEGLQAIATRVSTGDECSIIIEDGYAKTVEDNKKTWTEGRF